MEIPYGKENMGSGIEESVVDGIIRLDHREDNVLPILLRIFKMRGTSINREPHVCTISKNGMRLYPKQKLKSKVIELQRSGYLAESLVLTKESGAVLSIAQPLPLLAHLVTAKSTFAFQYIAEGVKKGEPGVFLSLEENAEAIPMMAKGYGYNTDGFRK